MRRLGVFCIFVSSLSAGPPAGAQASPDLLKTPECLAARQQLDDAFTAGGPRARLDAARERAALKCFGVKPSLPPESRVVSPPVVVDPIRLRPEAALSRASVVVAQPAAPAVSPPLPSVAVQRSPAVTSCDAAGCWDSDGARYNQQGPVLVGPRGICTVQAGVLNCP